MPRAVVSASRVGCVGSHQSAALSRRPLATALDIAEYCRVPLATVYQWSSRGGGPRMIRVGRHLRARWDDIDAWLDDQAVRAA
ncbi:helix-turn-helix transcriptional regulator [Streptomyces sp. NBC_01451]|uniref:helix-turn-helix transcriptional regulator n=1 Tax=Streptomyces sp. NBC_01451 TaxID=2903872 RepID=UPI002E364CBD|nr:helix-turn-helix domain-containing protein [Streptomyces sp. NBC_01451]